MDQSAMLVQAIWLVGCERTKHFDRCKNIFGHFQGGCDVAQCVAKFERHQLLIDSSGSNAKLHITLVWEPLSRTRELARASVSVSTCLRQERSMRTTFMLMLAHKCRDAQTMIVLLLQHCTSLSGGESITLLFAKALLLKVLQVVLMRALDLGCRSSAAAVRSHALRIDLACIKVLPPQSAHLHSCDQTSSTQPKEFPQAHPSEAIPRIVLILTIVERVDPCVSLRPLP
eukprot:7385003-Prymnesium_polylepis.2